MAGKFIDQRMESINKRLDEVEAQLKIINGKLDKAMDDIKYLFMSRSPTLGGR